MVLFTILILTLVLLCFIYWKHETSRSVQLIKKIPGPKAYPIIGNALDIIHTPVSLFQFARLLSNKYKGVSRMIVYKGRGVNIHDPENIEIILSSQKFITKGLLYDFVRPWLQDGLLTSTGDKWQKRRKILTPAFHFNILKEFCTVFFEQSEKLIQKLKPEVEKQSTEILPFLTGFTLNSISETAMGTNLDSVRSDVMDYKNSVYKIGHLIADRFTKVWLYPPFIYDITKDGKLHNKTISTLHNFTTNVIQERRKERNVSGNKFSVINNFDSDLNNAKKRLAMLDLLLTVEDDGNIDESGIREEVETFMFEGHDTTTVSLQFCLMLIANHQDVQDLIVAELDEIFKDKFEPVTMEKLGKMKYLERCIKEALRLYPSVPFISRYLSEDVQLKNYLIPAGTECSIHIFDLHRNAKYFPNPDKFDPDRFLPENCINRHPFAYIPFSGGARNCIGQRFAILEEKTVLSEILRNFKLEPITKPEDIVFFIDLVLRCRDPIKIKFIHR